jgi:hypothetical protein
LFALGVMLTFSMAARRNFPWALRLVLLTAAAAELGRAHSTIRSGRSSARS